MPIYAYRCTACGHAKDVLRKLSDPVLSECPACGQATFTKQVTAAGFQLKGSGWYVTDFRDGNKGGKAADKPADKGADGAPAETAAADKAADKAADPSAVKSTDKPASKAKDAAAGKSTSVDKPAASPSSS
jgi:putative FmdB family regulatory protein